MPLPAQNERCSEPTQKIHSVYGGIEMDWKKLMKQIMEMVNNWTKEELEESLRKAKEDSRDTELYMPFEE